MRNSLIVTAVLVLIASPVWAQPTFKLGVPDHVHPAAVLKFEGDRIIRSLVKDDPGFRLQFHVLKDGKTLEMIEARAAESIVAPRKEPGRYAVVLELFYPVYKPGTEQKGQFKAISPFLIYQVLDAATPMKFIDPEPAFVFHCGKAKAEEEKAAKGFGVKLVQGKPIEGWTGSVKPFAWSEPKLVRLELALPPETAGTLRLHLVDGDNMGRKCKVTIQGRSLPEAASFAGAGAWLTQPLSPQETKMGKVEIGVQNLLATGSAVISTIEFASVFAK